MKEMCKWKSEGKAVAMHTVSEYWPRFLVCRNRGVVAVRIGGIALRAIPVLPLLALVTCARENFNFLKTNPRVRNMYKMPQN